MKSPLLSRREKEGWSEAFIGLQFLIYGAKGCLLLAELLLVFNWFNLLWFGVCLCLGRKGFIVLVIVIGEEEINECFMERLWKCFFCRRATWGGLYMCPGRQAPDLPSIAAFDFLSSFPKLWGCEQAWKTQLQKKNPHLHFTRCSKAPKWDYPEEQR